MRLNQKDLHWLRFPFFSDKVIDLTESFGKVTYYPREIQFTLEKLRPKDAWLDAYNSFVQSYHGKSVRLVVPYDDTHYFNGRLVASSMVRGDFMSFSVTVTCDPYRYKNEITEVNVSVAGTQEVILTNEQKPVVPTIITDASVQVIHGANSYSINAGTHRLANRLRTGRYIGTVHRYSQCINHLSGRGAIDVYSHVRWRLLAPS